MSGCLDPTASNRDAAMALSDGSCVYECDTLSGGLGDSQCYIFSPELATWEADPPKHDDATFWAQLSVAQHVFVQGPAPRATGVAEDTVYLETTYLGCYINSAEGRESRAQRTPATHTWTPGPYGGVVSYLDPWTFPLGDVRWLSSCAAACSEAGYNYVGLGATTMDKQMCYCDNMHPLTTTATVQAEVSCGLEGINCGHGESGMGKASHSPCDAYVESKYEITSTWTEAVEQEAMQRFEAQPRIVGQSLTLRYLRIESHEAFGGGGSELGAAISCAGSTFKAEYLQVMGNTQKGIGSGVIFSDNSRVSIVGSVFQSNRNLGLGAGVLYAIEGSTVEVANTHFKGNTVTNEINLNVPDDIFKSASVVALDSSNMTIDAPRLEGNIGQSVIVAASSTLEISHTMFDSNSDSGEQLAALQGRRRLSVDAPTRQGATVSLWAGSLSQHSSSPASQIMEAGRRVRCSWQAHPSALTTLTSWAIRASHRTLLLEQFMSVMGAQP